MSKQDENKALVRQVVEQALNGGDLEFADSVFHEDYVAHVPGIGEMKGPEGFKDVIQLWHRACPDFHMTIEELVADGDLVANRFTTRGTNTGPLFWFPPTGKPMTVHGQELHRIQDGQIAESWICDDVPSILMQLGIVERPGPPEGGPQGGPPQGGPPGS
jgi:predicted ester cyclase